MYQIRCQSRYVNDSELVFKMLMHAQISPRANLKAEFTLWNHNPNGTDPLRQLNVLSFYSKSHVYIIIHYGTMGVFFKFL